MTLQKRVLLALGGIKFLSQTGAKNFVEAKGTLSFDLTKAAKNGITKVKILAGGDMVHVEFYRARKGRMESLGGTYNRHFDTLAATLSDRLALTSRSI